MKDHISLVSDRRLWFLDLSLRNVGLTDRIKYYLNDTSDKSYLSLVALIKKYIELNLLLVHYSINFDVDLLRELCKILQEKIVEHKIDKHAIYGDDAEEILK